MTHEREATTPLDDGTLLADCSCGGTYSVAQGGDEYAALEAAHREHIQGATVADLDAGPIVGCLIVFRIAPAADGTTRTAVYRPHGNPAGRILCYEGVDYLDNGASGIWWRGIWPFYEGGTLIGEARLDPSLRMRDVDNARCVIARTWGGAVSEHYVSNPEDLDVPFFRPEDWEAVQG